MKIKRKISLITLGLVASTSLSAGMLNAQTSNPPAGNAPNATFSSVNIEKDVATDDGKGILNVKTNKPGFISTFINTGNGSQGEEDIQYLSNGLRVLVDGTALHLQATRGYDAVFSGAKTLINGSLFQTGGNIITNYLNSQNIEANDILTVNTTSNTLNIGNVNGVPLAHGTNPKELVHIRMEKNNQSTQLDAKFMTNLDRTWSHFKVAEFIFQRSGENLSHLIIGGSASAIEILKGGMQIYDTGIRINTTANNKPGIRSESVTSIAGEFINDSSSFSSGTKIQIPTLKAKNNDTSGFALSVEGRANISHGIMNNNFNINGGRVLIDDENGVDIQGAIVNTHTRNGGRVTFADPEGINVSGPIRNPANNSFVDQIPVGTVNIDDTAYVSQNFYNGGTMYPKAIAANESFGTTHVNIISPISNNGTDQSCINSGSSCKPVQIFDNVRIGVNSINKHEFYGTATFNDGLIVPGSTTDGKALLSFVQNQHKVSTRHLEVNGDLTVLGDAYKTHGGTSWKISSDKRVKDIQENFTKGLKEIMQINTVRFNYKKDNALGLSSKDTYTGIIAQEVQKVIPEAISVDDKGYLQFNADSVYFAMLNAIKELAGQDDALKAEIKELKAVNAKLEARLSALEAKLK